jgi:ribosomal protein S18 acetylase RimI-like enzyme
METIQTSMGPVAIRPAVVEDAPAFRELRLQALRDHPVAFTADYDASLARPLEGWAERLTGLGSRGQIFFAFHAEQLVGMTGIQAGDSAKTRHSAFVWGVYVRPEWRGAGIVDALIEACMAWGRSHAVEIVKLGVAANNAAALRAYLRLGFSIYGVEPQAVLHDGVMYDELLMARRSS